MDSEKLTIELKTKVLFVINNLLLYTDFSCLRILLTVIVLYFFFLTFYHHQFFVAAYLSFDLIYLHYYLRSITILFLIIDVKCKITKVMFA